MPSALFCDLFHSHGVRWFIAALYLYGYDGRVRHNSQTERGGGDNMNVVRKSLVVAVAGLVLSLGAWQVVDHGSAVSGDVPPQGDHGGALNGDIPPQGDHGGVLSRLAPTLSGTEHDSSVS